MFYNHVKVNEFDKLEQVTREDGVRFYATPSGKKYPSVTTVLSAHGKQGLMEWRKRVGEEQANKIASAAARRGTKMHLHCENYLNNVDVLDTIPVFQRELFESIIPYLHKINNVHVQEQRLYSDHLRLAGTVDCVAEYEGRLAIIDYKTSSRREDKDHIHNYFMQCAAYAVMYEERTGIPVSKLVIIMAVENDEPQVFVEKRDNWVSKLLEYRDLYEKDKQLLTS